MPDRYVLILAGGRGERFWPWSRPDRPKQLLPLASGGRTLLAATIDRALRLTDADRILVLTAADLCDAVRQECPEGVHVLGEPAARNTAPAIAAAARWIDAQSRDAAFAVLPSDHAIENVDAFASDFDQAFAAAEREAVMLTFGISPTAPDTNFGYIRRGATVADLTYRVAAFTEKPDRERAAEWLASGDYTWNSGMFVWRCSTFMDALRAGRPAIANALQAMEWTGGDAGFEDALGGVFPDLEKISVDYAVLENAPNVWMREASFDWDDLGTWAAWARRQPRDERGNVVHGDAIVIDCDDCVVVGEGGTAAAVGQRGMIVVHVDGATLSCPLDASQEVRRVSDAVRSRG